MICIRPGTIADAEKIALLHRGSRLRGMPWLPMVHTPEEDFRFFGKTVLVKDVVYVAEIGADMAGFVAFQGNWLNHLYLAPAHWRKGIGSKLLDAAKDMTDHLQLWTFQQNIMATRVYTARGFHDTERTDGQSN